MTKKDWIWLVVVCLVALSATLITWVSYPKVNPPKQSETEKFLLRQKDSLVLEIRRLEAETVSYKERADKLQQDILDLNKNLINVQNKYDKEVSAVASYSNPELEQFFSNRYGK